MAFAIFIKCGQQVFIPFKIGFDSLNAFQQISEINIKMAEYKQKMKFESLQTIESQRFLSSIEQMRKQMAPVIKNAEQKQLAILSAIHSGRLSKEEQQLFENDAQISLIQSFKKTLQSNYEAKLAERKREHQKQKDKIYLTHKAEIEQLKKQFNECQKQLGKLRLEQRKNIRQFSVQMRQKKTQTELNQLKTEKQSEINHLKKLLNDKEQQILIINQTHEEKIKQIHDQFQQQRQTHKKQLIQAEKSINEQKNGFEQKDLKISDLEKKVREAKKQIYQKDLRINKITHPESFLTERNTLFFEFLNELANYPFEKSQTSNQNECKYFGVFGRKSCGKTSMLNHCLGLNLELQSKQKKQKSCFIQELHEIQRKNGNIKIFQSFGFINEPTYLNYDSLKKNGFTNDPTYLSFDSLKKIARMDRVFVCFESSIRENSELILVMLALKPASSLVFVKTKFELSNNFIRSSNAKELGIMSQSITEGINNKKQCSKIEKKESEDDDDEEEEEDDEGFKIYNYSSKESKASYEDNSKVKKLMKGV